MKKNFYIILMIVTLVHILFLGLNYHSHDESMGAVDFKKPQALHKLSLRFASAYVPAPVVKPYRSQKISSMTPKSLTSDNKDLTSQLVSSSHPQELFNEDRLRFKDELRSEIEKNKSYPPVSRRLGQTGMVEVAFTLLEDGHIINIRLTRASVFERLNHSALEAVRRVHKFKPIPREWGETEMDIVVSLKFVTI